MGRSKRIADVSLALILTVLLAPLVVIVALLVLLCDGRPVLYRSERMRGPARAFGLWKFRTMRAAGGPEGVCGGDQSARITRLGRVLRRSRLDELPQLWNILRGDMSFVGPRPPLRRYVALRPALYEAVLQARPGLTGLATLTYFKREETLLAPCRTAEETEAVYVQVCLPEKARLDLEYLKQRSLWFDLKLLIATVLRVWGVRPVTMLRIAARRAGSEPVGRADYQMERPVRSAA